MIKELILAMVTGGILGFIVTSLMSLLGANFLAPEQRWVFLIGSILFALTFRLLLLVREDNE